MAISRSQYMRKRFSGSQALLNLREQELVSRLLERLKPRPSEILDMPCGHGRFTSQLRAVTSKRLMCADLRESRLKALLDAEPAQGIPIETRTVDIFKGVDFPDSRFDLVFNFRFFHHVNDDDMRQHVITELARLSRRYIIVSYYDTVSIHALQKRIWQRKGHKPRLPMVPREEFLDYFSQRGFRMLEDKAVLAGVHAHRIALLERE